MPSVPRFCTPARSVHACHAKKPMPLDQQLVYPPSFIQRHCVYSSMHHRGVQINRCFVCARSSYKSRCFIWPTQLPFNPSNSNQRIPFLLHLSFQLFRHKCDVRDTQSKEGEKRPGMFEKHRTARKSDRCDGPANTNVQQWNHTRTPYSKSTRGFQQPALYKASVIPSLLPRYPNSAIFQTDLTFLPSQSIHIAHCTIPFAR